MEQNTWDISTFYHRAWQVIKKHKMLWIFGIAASAGGASFNSAQNFDSESFKAIGKFFSDPQTQKNVLGASDFVPTGPSFLSVFSEIPSYIYILLGIEVLFLVAIMSIIGLIYKAWATASLLHATEHGIHDQPISISDISHQALPHIRPLIWLQIVPAFLFALYFVVLATIIMLPLFSGISGLAILSAVVLAISIPISIGITLIYTLSNIWAPRNVIYYHLTGKEALINGYKQTKGRFWQMILLGIVNLIAGGLVMFVPAALGIGLFVAMSITAFKVNPNSLLVIAPLGLILGVAFFIGITLLSGIVTSFKAVVWSLAYKTMR